MRISVVGGGRWARTIATVLGALPDRSHHVTVHSPGNAAAIAGWIERQEMGGRLSAARAWPSFDAARNRPDAVIVANRAGDHFAAASVALRAGIPTLVEKPVCLASREILDLCKIAGGDTGATVFAASHVFLFARYLQAFSAALGAMGSIRGLRLLWTDGTADLRRGEAKSYDPAVSIFDDVLPHIVPMIGQIGFGDLSLVSFDVQRGGARLAVEADSLGRPVSLILARNDEGRHRRIEIATDAGPAILDFSEEPGFIQLASERRNGDPQWDSAPRPLATMLTAFLRAANGDALDPRLSPSGATAAADFAEVLRDRYLACQAAWLESRLGQPLDPSVHYALVELCGEQNRAPDAVAAAWSTLRSAAQLRTFLAKGTLSTG
jgi:predicted dehydrogenase